MDAWAAELLAVFRKNVPPISETIDGYGKRDSVGIAYSASDIAQVLMAIHGMMEEELGGQGSEARSTYVEVVVPSQVTQGEDLLRMIWYAVWTGIVLHKELIPLISAEHQQAASAFFTRWWAQYTSDMVQSGLAAGWKLPSAG
ncbi:hypothetical protein [Polyangium sp. 15x6]|uniref:hypothetical protein n=1 Tax=Polyangium sp. 15x6 TaxID=3042687 RepID=UPI00249C7DF8|nr:hypothetical protein [Polyangium sp. 15x6]MDI3284905.1 hypothetical protein [Polyangium sp. 15x6]